MSRKLKDGLIERKIVIWALFHREMIAKFQDSYFSYALILVEPFLHLSMFYLIFYFADRKTEGPILLFLLTGLIPYLFFSKTLKAASRAVSANEALLFYRQVKVIDTVLARILLEATISVTIVIVSSLIVFYFDNVETTNPMRIFKMILQLFMLTLGGSLICCVVSFYYVDFNKFLPITLRLIYFTSGIFYSLNDLPDKLAYFLSFNPIIQIIEYIRSGFPYSKLNPVLSFEYVYIFTIIVLFTGVSLYYVSRLSMKRNDRKRK